MNSNREVGLLNAFSGHTWSSTELSCYSKNSFVRTTNAQISIRATGRTDILTSKQKATCCRVSVPLRISTGAVSRSPITSRSILGEPILSASCSDLARFREFDPQREEVRAASSADLLRARNFDTRLLAANLDEAQPDPHLTERVEEEEDHVDCHDEVHGLRDIRHIREESLHSI